MSRKDLEQFFAVQRETDQRTSAGVLTPKQSRNVNFGHEVRLRQLDEVADAALDAAGTLLRNRLYELGVSGHEARASIVLEHLETMALKIYDVFSALPPKRKEEPSVIIDIVIGAQEE